MKKQRMNAYTLAFTGVMAAIVYVVTLFRFPLLGSKVHFANAMCLLSGMLFGGVYGGLAAGLGSALYDAFHGYDVINILITFVSKFMMAWVCARVLWSRDTRNEGFVRAIVAAVCGALTYVALYMLKTYIFGMYVDGLGMEATLVKMGTKITGSLLNALFASVVGPVLFFALKPALDHAGLLGKM